MELKPGVELLHYRIIEKIGEGGMGAVYRAEDTKLHRHVAIKLLPPEFANHRERIDRFETEARALAALNHPHVVTVHSVEQAENQHFIVMEFVEGESLEHEIGPQGITDRNRYFSIAEAILDGLAAAHERGIIHRDVKTANIVIASDGKPKLVDFGLARTDDITHVDQVTRTTTRAGAVLGTPAYMSPEQSRGLTVDSRTDVYSMGVILYEMWTGRRPEFGSEFEGSELPPPLRRIVRRCLRENPAARFNSGRELRDALRGYRSRKSRMIGAAIAVAALIAITSVTWWVSRSVDSNDQTAEKIQAIDTLVEADRPYDAYVMAHKAVLDNPEDPMLARLLESITFPMTIESDPPGATVSLVSYTQPDGEWVRLGTTPLTNVRVPTHYMRIKFELEGYETRVVGSAQMALRQTLRPLGTFAEDHLPVSAGNAELGTISVELPAFELGRFEVTNAEFQEFVDNSGYEDESYWSLPMQEVKARFIDRTGRPGPANWEFSKHPEGREQYPVSGVSWYEAEAYANWKGASLPTVYHWLRAAQPGIFADILKLSNVENDSKVPVGSMEGIGPFGHVDLAGNVKEWCLNPVGERRYTLGGGYDEAGYVFSDFDARSPFERNDNQGFRLAYYDQTPDDSLKAPILDTRYDFRNVKPVDDTTYKILAGFFDYSQLPINATKVTTVEGPYWRRETIAIDVPYDGPRLLIHLFYPKEAEPPFQAVVYKPSAISNYLSKIEDLSSAPYFLIRSGRVLVIPAYWDSLERQAERRPSTPQRRRDIMIRRIQDFRRTFDYLQTLPEIENDRLAYMGLSSGGEYGPLYLALEDRIKVGVLIAGGFHDSHMLEEPPEINPWNYAPRVKSPVLVINGSNDFMLPYESSQKPFFDLLGTPPGNKKLVTIEGGHVTSDRHALIRETLAWLDQYQ